MLLKDYQFEKPNIETKRLLLRGLTADDAADLEEWMPDPNMYTYWGRIANKNELNPRELFIDPRPHVKRKPSLDLRWGIALRTNNKIIGEMFIFNIENNRMAKVAYRISKIYWGQGLATEALSESVKFCFEKTELQRLWTDVDARNIASCKVLEKCGFIKEGFIRQGKMVHTYCDYFLYSMLKNDYIAL